MVVVLLLLHRRRATVHMMMMPLLIHRRRIRVLVQLDSSLALACHDLPVLFDSGGRSSRCESLCDRRPLPRANFFDLRSSRVTALFSHNCSTYQSSELEFLVLVPAPSHSSPYARRLPDRNEARAVLIDDLPLLSSSFRLRPTVPYFVKTEDKRKKQLTPARRRRWPAPTEVRLPTKPELQSGAVARSPRAAAAVASACLHRSTSSSFLPARQR